MNTSATSEPNLTKANYNNCIFIVCISELRGMPKGQVCYIYITLKSKGRIQLYIYINLNIHIKNLLISTQQSSSYIVYTNIGGLPKFQLFFFSYKLSKLRNARIAYLQHIIKWNSQNHDYNWWEIYQLEESDYFLNTSSNFYYIRILIRQL